MDRCLSKTAEWSNAGCCHTCGSTAHSLPQQAPAAALALAPRSSAAPVQPMDRYLTRQLNDSTQVADMFADGIACIPAQQAPTVAKLLLQP